MRVMYNTTPPQGQMQVIVRDRREGKTTALIKWMLEGRQIQEYPGWSRVIVCSYNKGVIDVTRALRDYTQTQLNPIELCSKLLPHKGVDCKAKHAFALSEIRKAVWGLSDLAHNIRGRGQLFEYAVDDIEYLLEQVWPLSRKAPAIITMTGELHDSSK